MRIKMNEALLMRNSDIIPSRTKSLHCVKELAYMYDLFSFPSENEKLIKLVL